MEYNYHHLTVVIPNWNGKKLLEKYLKHVIQEVHGAEIIIVDDNSTDDSVSYLKATYPKVKVIEKTKNEGFSSSVNLGVSAAKGTLILLLNTDIQPEKNFLESVFPHFDNPSVFAVGLMTKTENDEKPVLRGRGEARFFKGFYSHRRGEINKKNTAWVDGGSGVFRKDIWEQLGGLDTIFNPFYWEDIDLSYRALKAGYLLRFESQSVLFHRHEQGTIQTSYKSHQIQQITFRNQLLFMWKNITDKNFLLEHILYLLIQLFSSILKGELYYLYGFIHAVQLLPRCLKHRREVVHLFKKSDRELLSTTFS